MTSIYSSDVAKTVAVANADLMCEGIIPDPSQALAKISSFPGRRIFKDDKMRDYIRKDFVSAAVASVQENSGSDIEEYANEVSNRFSTKGSYGFLPASAVSGSVRTDFKCSTSSLKSVSFAQQRFVGTFGNVTLPSPLVKRDSLRALVDPEVLSYIDDIKTQDSADEFVAQVGAVYIDSAEFGGTLVMSSRSVGTSFTSKTELKAALSAEMTFLTKSVSAKNKFSVGTNTGKKTESMTVEIIAYGGDSTLILKGDTKGWIESMKDDPTVTSYRLSPISNLAEKGSDTEKLLIEAVRKVCIKARSVFKVIEPLIEPEPFRNGTYSIRSVESNFYLDIIWQSDFGAPVHQGKSPHKWILTETNSDGDGKRIITLKSTELFFYLNTRNGGRIHAINSPEKWILTETNSDRGPIITLKSTESNLYLNIDISDKRNGGKIFQGNSPQAWVLERAK